MSSELTLYGRPVGTVFDLLGAKENDITYSVGWALAQSDRFTAAMLADVLNLKDVAPPADKILLQEGVSGAGFTDIEVLAGDGAIHLIIEAKRGYDLPTTDQLAGYVERCDAPPTAVLVTAEASIDFVQGKLPESVKGVPVIYRSWHDLETIARVTAAGSRSHAEKRLLRELSRYLRGLMTMQNVDSNLVYVVSLGREICDSGITFRDVVVDHDVYFTEVGKPREPPNYLGFRFDGKLQQIRHVESYRVTEDDHGGFPPLKGKTDWDVDRRWWFDLGPVIEPSHTVKTGGLYRNQRVWAAIDLLLTSETISEARDKTKERLEAAGESL